MSTMTQVTNDFIKAITENAENLCVRIYGLDMDVWLDAAAVALSGGIYEYLGEVLESLSDEYHEGEGAECLEALRDRVLDRDIEVVDTDDAVVSAATRGSYFDAEEYNEILEVAEDMGEDVTLAGLKLDIPLDKIADAYCGSHSDDEDFAMEQWESCGYLSEVPENLQGYIDWERVARDLMIEHMAVDGHYFHTSY